MLCSVLSAVIKAALRFLRVYSFFLKIQMKAERGVYVQRLALAIPTPFYCYASPLFAFYKQSIFQQPERPIIYLIWGKGHGFTGSGLEPNILHQVFHQCV